MEKWSKGKQGLQMMEQELAFCCGPKGGPDEGQTDNPFPNVFLRIYCWDKALYTRDSEDILDTIGLVLIFSRPQLHKVVIFILINLK